MEMKPHGHYKAGCYFLNNSLICIYFGLFSGGTMKSHTFGQNGSPYTIISTNLPSSDMQLLSFINHRPNVSPRTVAYLEPLTA